LYHLAVDEAPGVQYRREPYELDGDFYLRRFRKIIYTGQQDYRVKKAVSFGQPFDYKSPWEPFKPHYLPTALSSSHIGCIVFTQK
jgi:hypothetical protein